MFKRTWRVLAAVGVAVVIGAGYPMVANAGPVIEHGGATSKPASAAADVGGVPAGFSSVAELMGVQNRLIAAAERINAAPGVQSGLAGIVARPESRRLKVYWKGSQSTAIRELISGLRQRVPIDVLPARFSAAELVPASREIARRPGVATAYGNVDGSGVTVTVTAGTARPRAVPEALGAIPVTVQTGAKPVATACTGRQDDCSPYFGGAMYNSACTTGFSIRRNGDTEMITAAHCADNGTTINDGAGENIGTAANKDAGRDTLLITHSAGVSSAGHVYVGPWDAGTSSQRSVTGTAASVVGAVVCTSGSFTGEHCEVRIQAVNITVNTDRGLFFPEVQAAQDSGGVVVGKGDSGGPVYFGNADGTVRGTGTISAQSNIVACPAGSPSVQCGSTVFYADLPQALAFYGATINTSNF